MTYIIKLVALKQIKNTMKSTKQEGKILLTEEQIEEELLVVEMASLCIPLSSIRLLTLCTI